MWMALICLWKRDYLPPCSSLSFTRSFILMQFLWISVRQISRICSFHFIAKIRIILFPHYSSLHILNNLNLDLSWSNFVLSNLIKKNSKLVQNPTIWRSCTLHQVSSVSRAVWRWVITDHTAHSFEGLEHRE